MKIILLLNEEEGNAVIICINMHEKGACKNVQGQTLKIQGQIETFRTLIQE
jgi:hypothetical protein